MNKADLYNRSNILQRRDAKLVIEEFGHLLCSCGSAGLESSDEELSDRTKCQEKGRETSRLLDIGTGSGDVLVDFVLPNFHNDYLLGTDISEEMVRYAKESYADLEDVEFSQLDIVGDVEAFLRNHSPFDHVTSFYCLHWIQNQMLALQNIHKLLKPNGNCLLAFISNMAIFDIYEDMAQTTRWGKFMYDVDRYISPYQHVKDPAEQATRYLEEIGFRDIRVEAKPMTFHYNGVPLLKKAVKAVNPFMKRMMQEDQEDYLEDYVRHTKKYGLMENPEDNEEDIRIRMEYTLLVVYGRKIGSDEHVD